jgi:hypothetical protein
MGLIGTTCIRCGTSIPRPEGAEAPTCASCADLLEGRARSADEPSRCCPVDGSAMGKNMVHGLLVDRCPSCHGVWLDGGELDLLEHAVADGDESRLATTVVLGLTRR